ncbi:MAG: hypothetical protein CM1200mP39_19130 [Dehalococcoidia bacterium]|nr:MAG: hypothetical protein CM1200mP39_19130 [Dehalococcoidia bacterium]
MPLTTCDVAPCTHVSKRPECFIPETFYVEGIFTTNNSLSFDYVGHRRLAMLEVVVISPHPTISSSVETLRKKYHPRAAAEATSHGSILVIFTYVSLTVVVMTFNPTRPTRSPRGKWVII